VSTREAVIMGNIRRTKQKGITRDKLVKIRVTQAEKEAITAMAEVRGLTVTRLLLQAIGLDIKA